MVVLGCLFFKVRERWLLEKFPQKVSRQRLVTGKILTTLNVIFNCSNNWSLKKTWVIFVNGVLVNLLSCQYSHVTDKEMHMESSDNDALAIKLRCL